MSKQMESPDTYYIPPNFIDTGTVMGGMFKLRNVIEAGVLAGAIVLLLFRSSLSLKAKIIVACVTALPVGILALIGIDGESLTTDRRELRELVEREKKKNDTGDETCVELCQF